MQVNLTQAIHYLQQGEVVAIPTETVYGLAADVNNEAALNKIFAVKQRPANNPLIIHIASMHQVTDYAAEFPPLAKKLAETFWPGPLTLVLKSKPHVSAIVRADAPTVALRVPAHPLTLQLLTESGLALAAPSANRYTQLSPTLAAHVEASLGHDIPVLDGGACQVGIESTIVSVEGDHWQLLRHGMISAAQIVAIAGKPALVTTGEIPKAPGQHLLHYSPNTPTCLFQETEALMGYAKTHPDCAVLLIGDVSPSFVNGLKALTSHCVQLAQSPIKVAEQLYKVLHQLDELKAPAILILLPPSNPEWAAILDRLTRAGYRAPV
ncbi:MAG: threonylcarbamoyl-AMP synthase [Methylophilaceae bacterium 17-44-8]|jgi:L-threonylcarbamoyladenylate synthase|nr:MAG: threonylcarbamoyl-AMP synthase [Methylophilales bacterium 28-44-11]OZA04682.1 MAG: threonylcarbamoyl-AMP synthase [Methylophilaceae bacterium 17-44-8]